MKIFADGSIIGRTAAMCDDYVGNDGQHGYFQMPLTQLRELIRRAHRSGWQVATHAIGDRAVREILDCYEAVLTEHPRRDHRHRIEHCGFTGPEDIERISRLGVIPVPQGRFIAELGDGVLAAVGAERVQCYHRQRSFLDAGIEVPASSDRPVVDGRPMLGLQALIERRTAAGTVLAPDERMTRAQALRAYTFGSAYAAFAEQRLGLLAPGYLADLAVLSADPLQTEDLESVAVLATVVGGELVHDAVGIT
jgi:predicted amidohydrolase YtcJ